jgi:hypothetical protein
MTRIMMMHQEATAGAEVAGAAGAAGADAEEVNLQEVEVLHVVEVADGLDRAQLPLTLMTVSR